MSRGWVRLVGALSVVGGVAACQARERLTFPTPGAAGSGPILAITAPHRDTGITVGDSLNIRGYAIDPDGVDSIWFSVQGIAFFIPPIFGNGRTDTVFFEQHFSGSAFADTGTVTFFATAVDELSDTGFTRSLSILVRP
ncbi:MAG: hypothetical protein WBC97_05675 [Gemmatimonadales bacterium]